MLSSAIFLPTMYNQFNSQLDHHSTSFFGLFRFSTFLFVKLNSQLGCLSPEINRNSKQKPWDMGHFHNGFVNSLNIKGLRLRHYFRRYFKTLTFFLSVELFWFNLYQTSTNFHWQNKKDCNLKSRLGQLSQVKHLCFQKTMMKNHFFIGPIMLRLPILQSVELTMT